MNSKDSLSIVDNIHEHYAYYSCCKDINSVVLLQDGRIAAAPSNYNIYILNPNTPTEERQFDIEIENKSECACLCLLNNGKLIATSYKNCITIFSINENSATEVFKIDNIETNIYGFIYKVITLPGNRFAFSSDDGVIRIAKADEPYSEKLLARLGPTKGDIKGLVYLKESDLLISLSKEDILFVWNATTYKLLKAVEGVDCTGNNSMCEIDGERVLVGGVKKFNIVNVKEGKIEDTIENRRFGIVFFGYEIKRRKLFCVRC